MDRSDKNEILKQIGRVEESIKQINREISVFDKELNGWEERKAHLLKRKDSARERIGKKHKYLNQLESDLTTLNKEE